MSETFKVQGYTFIVARKNETALSISATNELNKSLFESGVVELKKVKCDTVAAALNNPQSKNLSIKTHYEEGNQPFKGQLLLSIIVKYEFLPEFSEDIVLQERKLDEGDALKVRVANLEKEIDTLNKTMEIIGTQGIVKVKEQKNSGLRENNNIELTLVEGKYLIQISGLHKANSYSTLGFIIDILGKNKNSSVTLNKITPFFINATYSYPFSISEVIELTENSTIKVYNKETNTYNSTASNFVVTAKPVLC